MALEQAYTIPTYYTLEDSDRSDEMYELLELYQINSKPSVVLVQDSKVLELWNSPLDSMDEIKNICKYKKKASDSFM